MTTSMRDNLELLRRTPDVIRGLLRALPDSWTATPDVAKDGWTPKDVVGHLITGELSDWLERTQRIIDHGTSLPFEPFERFAHRQRDETATLDDLIERFAELRAANVSRFEALVSEGDLGRMGMHPALGRVSLGNLLATWAVHDLDHLGQVFVAMAASRDADVGPWKAYLGILLRRDDPTAVPG
ncbi:MAG TPA: DinB family protein [Candidatus Limnocylindrales bacterium]|nr:DinB family protein [Candidatus Limnocylindrales bacterium]